MDTIEAVQTVTLRKTEDGTIRIGDHRLTLDSVAYSFFQGASAEELTENFPGLRLSEAHGVISYILENREFVDKYLDQQRIDGDRIIADIRTKFGDDTEEFRKKIHARAAEIGFVRKSK